MSASQFLRTPTMWWKPADEKENTGTETWHRMGLRPLWIFAGFGPRLTELSCDGLQQRSLRHSPLHFATESKSGRVDQEVKFSRLPEHL